MIVRSSIDAGSSGTMPSRPSMRHDHSARMLAEMPRKIEDAVVQLGKFLRAEIFRRIKAFFLKPAVQLFAFESLVMRIETVRV